MSKRIPADVRNKLFPDMRIFVICAGRPEDEAVYPPEHAHEHCTAHGFDAQVALIQGDPHAEIPRYADVDDADIVVMGSGPRMSPMRRTFGHQAIAMARAADRPMVLIH